MPADFVALIAREDTLPAEEMARFDDIAASAGLTSNRLADRAVVALRGPSALATRVAIAGEIYARHSNHPRDLAATCAAVERGENPPLAAQCWGSYLLLELGDKATTSSLTRSAFGDHPCFWIEERRAVLAASSPALLRSFAETQLRIDWDELGQHLLAPQMRTEATCLEGVRELPGGCTLEVGPDKIEVRRDWSPWPFVRQQDPGLDRETAARRVANAVDGAVAARCRSLTRPVLLLSGGIDSSTVAAALKQSGTPFASLTMVTRQKSGDEREYARAVAERTGSPLTECTRELAAIDWSDRTPARHARPSSRLFRHPTLAAAQQLAAANGADTIIDGGGGDNLFCSLQSAVPVLDRYAAEGLGRGVWTTARDIALRAGVPIASVLLAAWRRRSSGRVAFRWPTDPRFLAGPHKGPMLSGELHPWLDPPSGTLPGQAAQAALALGALSLAEDDSTDPALRTISPLVAQPVVEAVLQVPSWLWFENGHNRALIRRAYAGRLPPIVLERSGKGTPAGFMFEVVEANRDRLRELLLDGALVAHGVADRAAIEAALGESALDADNRFDRLLVLADAERWARLWL